MGPRARGGPAGSPRGVRALKLSDTRWTWVEAAGRGEGLALETFVEKYRPAVVGFFLGRLPGEHVAEDLAQEVFLQVFRDGVLERADRERGRLRSLLFAVARNVLGHHLERRSAHKRGGNAQHVGLEGVAEEGEDEALFDREWLLHLLDLALQRLQDTHPRYHEVLSQTLAGRSQAEVGQALGESLANVKSLVHRGKRRLCAHLQELVAESATSQEDFEAELRVLAAWFPDR